MQNGPPILEARHKSGLNILLAMSLAVAAVGIVSVAPLLIIVGIAVAAYSWFTTPVYYLLYDDHLSVGYGKPRIRRVSFSEIKEMNLLNLKIGSRLRLRLKSGRVLFIQPRDLEAFDEAMRDALARYGSNVEGYIE